MDIRRRAASAYAAQRAAGKTIRVRSDLFAAEAALVLARNALDKADAAVLAVPLEVLVKESVSAAIDALLPPTIGALVALYERLGELIDRLRSPELLPLSRQVAALGALLSGFGLLPVALSVAARLIDARQAVAARAEDARSRLAALRRVIRELRAELSRLGHRGVLVDLVG